MKLTRLKGVTSNFLLCNALQIVKATGSNQNIGTFANATVNDIQVPSITSAVGLYVIVFDENLTQLETRRFNLLSTSPAGRRDIDFINFMGTIAPRRYYLMVSNGNIGHTSQLDNFFETYLKTPIWSSMWSDFEMINGVTQSAPLSFCAFGNSELGITHQSYSLTMEASINVNISDYDRFVITGYGVPLLEISNESFGANYTEYTLDDLIDINALCISLRYNASVNNDDIIIRKVYTDNSVSDQIVPVRTGTLNKLIQYHVNLDGTETAIKVLIKNVHIYYATINKANSGSIDNPISSVSKKGKGLSVKDTRFSLNGRDFENPAHLQSLSNASNIVSNFTGTENIDGIDMPSIDINTSFISDFIEVDNNMDYYLGMFLKRDSVLDTTVTISIHGYDENNQLIDLVSLVDLTGSSNITLGQCIINSEDIVYQEYYILSSKQSLSDTTNAEYLLSGVHGTVQNGGLSANINEIDDIGVMTGDIKYIKVEINSSSTVKCITPIIEYVRFALTKDSRYLGNITQD